MRLSFLAAPCAAVLEELSIRHSRPLVVIFHGDQDQVVPVTMPRTLAGDNKRVSDHEMPGLNHNDIVEAAAPQIATALARMER